MPGIESKNNCLTSRSLLAYFITSIVIFTIRKENKHHVVPSQGIYVASDYSPQNKWKKSKIIPTDLLTAPHYALKIENRFECNREREKFSSS